MPPGLSAAVSGAGGRRAGGDVWWGWLGDNCLIVCFGFFFVSDLYLWSIIDEWIIDSWLLTFVVSVN